MTALEIIFLVVLCGGAFAYLIGSTIWVAKDAPKRGITNGMPAAMTFLMGPFGLLMWLIMRPPLQDETPHDN